MDDIRTLQSIRTAHWQPRLGHPGQVVEGWADIDQAIRIILGTPKGSDRHRPDFGLNGRSYLDWPVDRAIPHLVREAITEIRAWEPRVNVEKIDVRPQDAGIVMRVVWRAADGVLQQTEVNYERASAA